MTEDEAYEEIEERLGIQALRIAEKPQDMVLEKVYIDDVMGEAQMEFSYENHVLVFMKISKMTMQHSEKK